MNSQVTRLILEAEKNKTQHILDLSNQNLIRIPETIRSLHSIKVILLRNNRISKIENLPYSITELDISLNKISKIENMVGYDDLNILDISENQISKIENLPLNLKNLYIEFNQISKIENLPDNLELLFIGNNLIRKIKNLPDNLSTLDLRNNEIRSLIDCQGTIYKSGLRLSWEEDILKIAGNRMNLIGNPIRVPTKVGILIGHDTAMREIEIFKVFEKTKQEQQIEIPIPIQIRTAIKQYLIYFNDYAKITKGLDVSLEVKNGENGVIVELSPEQDKVEIGKLLEEYFCLVREKIEEINPVFSIEIDKDKRDIFMVELRNEIRHLKGALETKAVEIRFLENSVERLNNLLLIEKQNPIPIVIQASNTNQTYQQNNQSIENKVKIKLENSDKISETIESIKDIVLADKELDNRFKSDVFGLFIELEKELATGEINKSLKDQILEQSAKISSIGTFVINLMRYMGI